jgi:hypothetical protein
MDLAWIARSTPPERRGSLFQRTARAMAPRDTAWPAELTAGFITAHKPMFMLSTARGARCCYIRRSPVVPRSRWWTIFALRRRTIDPLRPQRPLVRVASRLNAFVSWPTTKPPPGRRLVSVLR